MGLKTRKKIFSIFFHKVIFNAKVFFIFFRDFDSLSKENVFENNNLVCYSFKDGFFVFIIYVVKNLTYIYIAEIC